MAITNKILLVSLMLIGALSLVKAMEPEEQLKDPTLETRARALGRELRCVVCENETIDASQAPLAADLRRLLRQRLVAGDSDSEIRKLLSDRYGDYVLFRPRFSPRNLLLWIGPFGLLAVVGGILIIRARRMKPEPAAALLAEEEAAVQTLLDDTSDAPAAAPPKV